MTREQSDTATETGPCRVCGSETPQKLGDEFLCSSSCRPPPDETYECPYPECDWTAERRGDSVLSRAVFRADIRSHRRTHNDD